MEKANNVQKFTFYMTALILFVVMIQKAGGADEACMDLALCNLLKGDLSQESPVLKSDTSKFYKVAEDNLVSSQTICEGEVKKCIEDVNTMAIDILQFPKKYKDSCNYKSYSRSLFACKNRINWPKSVANQLPVEYTNCHTDCLIDEDQPYNLSNGKALFDFKFPFPDVSTDDVIFDGPKSRSIGIKRTVARTLTAFNDAQDGLTWTSIDACPDKTWGSFVYHWAWVQQGFPIRNLVVYCSRLDKDKRHIDIIQTYPNSMKEKGNLTTSRYTCGSNLIPVRGIKVQKIKILSDSGLAKDVIKFCKDEPPGSGPGVLDCPKSEAICTIQAKNYFPKDIYTKNIRIGCCDLKPELPPTTTSTTPASTTTSLSTTTKPSTTTSLSTTTKPSTTTSLSTTTKPSTTTSLSTTTKPSTTTSLSTTTKPSTTTSLSTTASPSTTSPSKTTSPSATTSRPTPEDNSTLVNVYELQKRERYFWDQVIFDHITRYNRFYSPYTVIDETEWITTKCPTGTFVNGIKITNPNSEYFVWRRIMELAFKCGDPKGGQRTELNIYGRLRNKYGLEEVDLNKSFECINGYYTFVQFEYYTEKDRNELVHGWGIRMECSINGKTEEHNYAFNSSAAMNVLSETVIETAKDDCGAKNAICGFTARLADERIGSFEGFLLKTICCKI